MLFIGLNRGGDDTRDPRNGGYDEEEERKGERHEHPAFG
jgi:hypothetical protein